MNPRILCAVGTRPEAIKMAPVIEALRAREVEVSLVVTGQHGEIVTDHLRAVGLVPDRAPPQIEPTRCLADLTAQLLSSLNAAVQTLAPDAVLAQGDTLSAFAAALAAYYARRPLGLVEAGLRSGALEAPFPEEALRRMASVVARWQFAPTPRAQRALLSEGYASDSIHLVGNTGIDMLERVVRAPERWPAAVKAPTPDERLVVATLHRRENLGERAGRIRDALAALTARFPALRIVLVRHPYRAGAEESGGDRRAWPDRIQLLEPLPHVEMVALLRASFAVLTDSGGLEEECCHLGVPLLILRDVTERPEVVEAGGGILVGAEPARILAEASRLLTDPAHHAAMARPRPLYGDGQAGVRIAEVLARALAPTPARVPAPSPEAEAIARWLLSDQVQMAEGLEAGAVAGWLDDEGQPAFLYPEVTGYYLTALAFLARVEPCLAPEAARRARAAAAWLDRRAGHLPTRIFTDDVSDDFRNGATFAFDLAMCIRGLDAAAGAFAIHVNEARATLLDRLARHCAPDGMVAAIARGGAALPTRWSTTAGPYQLKIAAGLLGGTPVPPAIEEACRAVCERHAQVTIPVEALHPTLYALEGLLSLGVRGTPEALVRAREGLSSVLERLAAAPADGERADVLAQVLRLGAALRATGTHLTERQLTPLAAARALLLARVGPRGGVCFHDGERRPRHWNVWAAIFAVQALWLWDQTQRRQDVDPGLLALLA